MAFQGNGTLFHSIDSPLEKASEVCDVYFDGGGHTLPKFHMSQMKSSRVLNRKGWSSNFQSPFFRVYLKLHGVSPTKMKPRTFLLIHSIQC